MTNITGTVAMVLRHKGRTVWSVSPQSTVYEALALMADKNIGAVVVIDERLLVGLFSERDWARRSPHAHDPRRMRVSELVTREPVCVSASDDVSDCLRLMTDERVRHLPVVDGDELIGIVSIGDLVSWVMGAQDSTIEQLEHYITGVYPA